MVEQTNKELLEFIGRCPSSFHTVTEISERLRKEGYLPLEESKEWELQESGKYFVTRNNSSVIAFRVPAVFRRFMITASHGESPAFKIKTDPEMPCEGCYIKLNTEKYGGMIYHSWLDRPLSVAGRVTVLTETGMETRLVNIDKDLLMIPSLAIHMDRTVNEGGAMNPQKELLPLFGDETAKGGFWKLIAENVGVTHDKILGSDLFLYCRTAPSVWGNQGEFLSSPRLDDLQCAFATLQGFLKGDAKDSMPVYCVFDNEEVGSGTKQGAKSTFLFDVLQRICEARGVSQSGYRQAVASGFLLSADNGHAVHPNYPEKADPTNRPKLNGGLLLKYNANQKYTTDAVSEGLVRYLCQKAAVPVQNYVNRSDIPGGSTLGNLLSEKVSINTADIGVAQLAMHSAYETVGAKDTIYLCKAIEAFYNLELICEEDGSYRLA
ncbi:MAG: M18 family aminopeptidase [Clostridia bacterium]|nr:M18 family aminopeptidase [Clostridia bacterium]